MTAGMSVGMQDLIDQSISDLIASGQADRSLKAGAKAPSFKLPDSAGKIVSSADLLAIGSLVIAFYRGAWCPYCNFDLEALEAAYGKVRSLGASLVAISQQTPQNNGLLQRDLKISFPLLSDKGGSLAKRFGIRFALPENIRRMFKEMDIDLASSNGESSWTLPIPARYVVDQPGTIVFAELNPDYRQRPEPDELMPILRRLQQRRHPI